MVRWGHFDHELNQFTRCEILPDFPLEKVAQKSLKGNAFHIQICLVEVNALQVIDNGEQLTVINFDIFRKDLRISCLCLLIQRFNSLGNRFGAFMGLNLKVVRFTVLPCFLFISDFDKEQLGEFIKRICWRKSPALPERVMALFQGADELCPFNDQ